MRERQSRKREREDDGEIRMHFWSYDFIMLAESDCAYSDLLLVNFFRKHPVNYLVLNPRERERVDVRGLSRT